MGRNTHEKEHGDEDEALEEKRTRWAGGYFVRKKWVKVSWMKYRRHEVDKLDTNAITKQKNRHLRPQNQVIRKDPPSKIDKAN